jgi:hypothetical protein
MTQFSGPKSTQRRLPLLIRRRLPENLGSDDQVRPCGGFFRIALHLAFDNDRTDATAEVVANKLADAVAAFSPKIGPVRRPAEC